MFSMRFIHLTDPHLIETDGKLYGIDPYQRFSQAVGSITSRHADQAEFAVITGDLAHWGEAGAYQKLKELLERMPFKTDLVIGNHDNRVEFRKVFPDAYSDEHGFVQGWRDHGDYRLVFLDTVVEGTHAGGYCESRCAWLDGVLSASDKPVMLFMHHPPFLIGLPAMDAIALRDRQRLEEVLLPHRDKVRQIFFGHVHRPICGNWHGIATSTIYGTNHQVALDFESSEDNISGSDEGPAYCLVFSSPDHVVIHQHQYLLQPDIYSMNPAYGEEAREYALGDFNS